jgi:dTDP-4-amino-4,6-dideoxygalactose transaminase
LPVKFLDVRAAYEDLRPEIDIAVARSLASGSYVGGPEVEAFEQAFAKYCETDHCVGMGNGLDALHLALRALDVGPGDEVIVSSNTYIATWLAVTIVGAKPVPVEPDPATYNLDPGSVEQRITRRTRVILPTHLYGQSADLDPLIVLCRRHGLKLLEDAAQAHGARYKGRRIGSHGDAVAWSFYPGKNLGALGDGGAVTTNDPKLAQRLRMLGNYGSSTKYVHEIKGVNSRLDPLQAAVLRIKLNQLDAWNLRRKEIARSYEVGLQGLPLILPAVPDWADPVWHLYAIRSADRNSLRDKLAAAGIETLIHYPVPPHLQAAYSDLAIAKGSLPIAEQLADEELSLPIGPHMARSEVDSVIEAVRAATASG